MSTDSNARLFSYCIPCDDGAAPNPFWGTCTLAICKPVIRRKAQRGDWIIATGSKKLGHDRLVYAMKVTSKLTMAEYDRWTQVSCPRKVPSQRAWKDRKGDSIYDFSASKLGEMVPRLREGSVHKDGNRKTDLEGRFVLLSDYFYYFGDKAIPLPEHLLPVVKEGRGHRSTSIGHLLPALLEWLGKLPYEPNELHGTPEMWKNEIRSSCALRAECAAEDEKMTDVEHE